MFGYVTPRVEDLAPEERKRYRAAYCGLCHALAERHGQGARFALTYDMTFLALVLGSLYEPTEQCGTRRCVPHPLKAHAFVQTECTAYAADMTVALVYHKCLDDWEDDRALRARISAQLLEKAYRTVRDTYPRQCRAIEQGMADIHQMEEEARAGSIPAPDAAANRFGELLAEVFVWREDFWADALRAFGSKVGKFVYVMDAAVDMDDDRASGSYNPLVLLNAQPDEVREDLQLLAADVAAAFEKLPLEQDAHALRSVMYAGMWQAYHKKIAAKEKAAKEKTAGEGGAL